MWCGHCSAPGCSDGWVNHQRFGQEEYSSFLSCLFPHRDHLLWTANAHIIYFIALRVFKRTNWSNLWIFMFCLFIFRDWKTHIFCSRPQPVSFTDALKTSLQIHWEVTSSSKGCSHIIAVQYYLHISLVGFPPANWELIFSYKNPYNFLLPALSIIQVFSLFLSLHLSYKKKSQMSKCHLTLTLVGNF